MTGLLDFVRHQLGVELYPGQRAVLEECLASGRRTWLLCLGRRSGKGLMAACAALYNAMVPDYGPYLRPGESRYIIVVATRLDQAREFVRVCRELLAHAADADLRQLVDEGRSTLDEIAFRNGVVIRAMPCSSRSTRGLPVSLLVMDEAAWMLTTDEGYAAGKQVWQALAPSLAQFGDAGYALVTSTPNWRTGIFWELYDAATTGRRTDVHVVQRPTWEVNAGITREALEGEFSADPQYAAREYGAQFTEGAGAYLEAGDIFQCRRAGGVLPPQLGFTYKGALDPGYLHDRFALCIGHLEAKRVIIDGVWTWRRHGHDATLDEVAAVAKRYGVMALRTDQHSPVPVQEGLRKRGLYGEYVPWTNESKSNAFNALKVALNTGAAELPHDDGLIQELCSLEARPTPGGLTRIAAVAGGFDDRAVVTAAVVEMLTPRVTDQLLGWFADEDPSDEEELVLYQGEWMKRSHMWERQHPNPDVF